jgi:hypothetical protein
MDSRSEVEADCTIYLRLTKILHFRHYKLEAAIASMSWRVQWSDIMVVPPGKQRGSVYSLAKRGSQVVSLFSEQTQG